MNPRLFFFLLPLFAVVAALAAAQDGPRLDPHDSSYHPPVPTVIFDLNFPGASPSHYTVAVNADGKAAYQSNGGETSPTGTQSTGDPNIVAFTMSAAARARVFALVKKLNYLAGTYDYTRTRVANTGAKTLAFADSSRHNATTYNYSQNPDIQELTRFFQSVSSTMEFGRRLERDLRFDKLDLPKQLQLMLSEAQDKQLAEVEAVVPVLQKISADPTIMRIARVNADRLLAMAGAPLATR
jgi:hypothetical protein